MDEMTTYTMILSNMNIVYYIVVSLVQRHEKYIPMLMLMISKELRVLIITGHALKITD